MIFENVKPVNTAKSGAMVSIETILIVVMVVLVVITAMAQFATKASTVISSVSDSIEKQSSCILSGGTWNASTGTCG